MARKRKPSTRYSRIHALLGEGKAGLLSWEGTCPCPKRGGPDHPHGERPGMAGYGTCKGCRYHLGPYFNSQVCTHPNAHRVAAKSLGDILAALEKPKPKPRLEPEPEPEPDAQMSMF